MYIYSIDNKYVLYLRRHKDRILYINVSPQVRLVHELVHEPERFAFFGE